MTIIPEVVVSKLKLTTGKTVTNRQWKNILIATSFIG